MFCCEWLKWSYFYVHWVCFHVGRGGELWIPRPHRVHVKHKPGRTHWKDSQNVLILVPPTNWPLIGRPQSFPSQTPITKQMQDQYNQRVCTSGLPDSTQLNLWKGRNFNSAFLFPLYCQTATFYTSTDINVCTTPVYLTLGMFTHQQARNICILKVTFDIKLLSYLQLMTV